MAGTPLLAYERAHNRVGERIQFLVSMLDPAPGFGRLSSWYRKSSAPPFQQARGLATGMRATSVVCLSVALRGEREFAHHASARAGPNQTSVCGAAERNRLSLDHPTSGRAAQCEQTLHQPKCPFAYGSRRWHPTSVARNPSRAPRVWRKIGRLGARRSKHAFAASARFRSRGLLAS